MLARNRQPLILFDGVCNLCNAWVRFVIRCDRAGLFNFAAQQSPTGQEIIEDRVKAADQLSSVLLLEGDAIYAESDAVIEILARLPAPWSCLAVLRLIPHRLRDVCYRFVVRHRYQWFGRTETCQTPSPEMRSRFID
jgi:predicted DCC family thiol-disulfide oxidoreductase YuxK